MITLRRASYDEAELIREWRNHPGARAMSLSTRVIGAREHRRWWEVHGCDVWIVSVGGPAGYWRADGVGDEAAVSVLLCPAQQGKGLAAQVIRLGTRKALRCDRRCRAEIRIDNCASMRAFLRAGYRWVGASRRGRFWMVTLEARRKSC
jgi:RimJ/RimL family protein N-acetyltransferase